MKKQNFISLLKDLYARFTNDDLPAVGAQITYFLLLSLSPFLIFLITLITFTPVADFQSHIQVLESLMPGNAYEILRDIIDQTINSRSGAALSLGLLFALWAATNGVSYLIRGVNRAYDQEETRPFWKAKLVSLIITLELSFVIIISMVIIIFGGTAGAEFFSFLGLSDTFLIFWNVFRFFIPLLTIILVLASIYYSAPDRRLAFCETLPGATAGALLWVIASYAFSFYADNLGNYSVVYGSLSGIIVLLIWMYLSSMIFLLGAEINASLLFSREGLKKTVLKKF